MKYLKKLITKLFSFFCVLTILLTCFAPMTVFADDEKVVKVGWYQCDRFQEGMNDSATKKGYSYQYLQKISNYNSWTYEYVYGDWTELFEKLKDGEIDVLAGVSDTLERETQISYPKYNMGNDNYYVYQQTSKTMNLKDKDSFKGMVIGTVKDNRMSYYLKKWKSENNLDFTIQYYDGITSCDQAFIDKKVDGIVSTDNNVLGNTDYSLVDKIGNEPIYLAVTKGRSDLLSELNSALTMMNEMDPYFLQNLQYSCYGTTLSDKSLTKTEREWLNSHDTLTVGYMDDYLPYCDSDKKGYATGLMTDVLDASLEKLEIEDQLKVVYKSYKSYKDMVKALQSGNLDVVFPVGSGWSVDEDNIDYTAAVVSASMYLVCKEKYDSSKDEKFAVNGNNELQINYIKENYSDAELLEYDSIDECINAVYNGKANCTVINGLRTNIVRENSKYNHLTVVQLQKPDVRAMGVRHGNTALLLLLNRGLKSIGSDYGINASYNYMDYNSSITLKDLIVEHLVLFIVLVVLAVGLILTFGYLYIRSMNKAQKALQIQLEKNNELTYQLEVKNKELEEAKESAEFANNAKTSFLFNMSHDIRTPMNAIIGFRNLLEKYQEDPEKRENYLKKIEESSNVLLSIINNVLEMSRIEKGKLEIDETAWSAEQFSDSLYSIFKEMMDEKGITYTRQINVQHHYVFCDAIKLREIFINILSNAYKYTNTGGSVEMYVKELPCDKEGWVFYSTTVTDTGIGMSEEFLKHIFEEFSRENNTTDIKVEGTGLGMPIVKRLVDLLGGTIEVKSTKGVGSSFTVTLPHRIADKTNLVDHSGIEFDPKLFKGKHILLAEDNDLNAEIAIEILGEAGFIIDRADDGAICVDMLEKAEPNYYDLILMDIQMPNMNGYEATRTIRSMSDPNKANIKILAMTANAFEEDKREAFKAGMNGHIGKPINVKELMKEIANMLI